VWRFLAPHDHDDGLDDEPHIDDFFARACRSSVVFIYIQKRRVLEFCWICSLLDLYPALASDNLHIKSLASANQNRDNSIYLPLARLLDRGQ